MVWPRLRAARNPPSNGSDSITLIFTAIALRTISARLAFTEVYPRAHISNNAGSAMMACLTTSPRPERNSSSGNVHKLFGSDTTSLGEWNAPIRFFPSGKSQPVFPPIEESTIASKDVGTPTQGMPRMNADAAKPARSPVTPPPRATTILLRSKPAPRKPRHRNDIVSRVLYCSPGGMITGCTVNPAPRSDSITRSPYSGKTLESTTIANLPITPRSAIISPNRSNPSDWTMTS